MQEALDEKDQHFEGVFELQTSLQVFEKLLLGQKLLASRVAHLEQSAKNRGLQIETETPSCETLTTRIETNIQRVEQLKEMIAGLRIQN